MYVIASLAVVIAVYVAAGRLISAWSRRVLPVAEVVPLAAAQPGPDQPPRVPPLKKAA
jgi:hypothetical protein